MGSVTAFCEDTKTRQTTTYSPLWEDAAGVGLYETDD